MDLKLEEYMLTLKQEVKGAFNEFKTQQKNK